MTRWTLGQLLVVGCCCISLGGCGKDYAQPSASPIRINEVNPHNVTWQDLWGGTGDWIELYNGGDQVVDLAGYYISDSGDRRYKYMFESQDSGAAASGAEPRVLVKPHDVLLVWADASPDKSTPTAPHLDFKLSASGEGVWLSNPAGYLVDSVEFGKVPPNSAGTETTSIARFPDGSGLPQWCTVSSPEHLNGGRCTGEAL